LQALNVECTIHLQDTLQELGVDPQTFLPPPVPGAWQARFDQNTAGRETTVAPVLTMQGTTDTVVNPTAPASTSRRLPVHAAVQYSITRGQPSGIRSRR